MSTYHVHTGGMTLGPLTEREARSLHESKPLAPDTLVSKDGQLWAPATNVFPQWFEPPVVDATPLTEPLPSPVAHPVPRGVPAVSAGPMNPYQAPAAIEAVPEPAFPADYPGIGRGLFFLALVVFAAVGSAAQPYLAYPWAKIVSSLVILVLTIPRLRNIGSSALWSLLTLVPIASLFVIVRCLVLPTGYAHHRQLDKLSKVLLVLIILGIVATFISFWSIFSGVGSF